MTEVIILATFGSIEQEGGKAYLVKVSGEKAETLIKLLEEGLSKADAINVRDIIEEEIRNQKLKAIDYDYHIDFW